MSLAEMSASARHGARSYGRCSHEQALVYACEDVVAEVLGARGMPSIDARTFIERVCDAEDLDPPTVLVERASPKTRASADQVTRTICIRGRHTTSATIIHEIAHLSSGAEMHDHAFRTELVRLSRRHVSVEHASLLRALLVSVELSVGDWTTGSGRH